MIIISHQERIISLADEVIVVGDGAIRHRGTREGDSAPDPDGYAGRLPGTEQRR